MLIQMERNATEDSIIQVRRVIETAQLEVHSITGEERVVIAVIGVGDSDNLARTAEKIESCPQVVRVVRITHPWRRVSREVSPQDTVVQVNGQTTVGGKTFTLIAGPCSVESKRQLKVITSRLVGRATMLRGGAFKPRTSPDSFEGMREEGLKLLSEEYERTKLPIVTEVMDARDLELICRHAHVLQIGARNCQNYTLLNEVGKTRLPVLLKRGWAHTLAELLLSAERIVKHGNSNVILCERGVRGYTEEEFNRFTLDLGAVAALRSLTHLPVIVDPSHAAGYRELVARMAFAAMAAGADGIMVEVHNNPEKALSDGRQSLTLDQFNQMHLGLLALTPFWQHVRHAAPLN